MTALWTDDPAARALLDECAHRPPARVRHTCHYPLTTDEWREYSRRSPRVRALDELHAAAFAEAERVSREAALAVLSVTVDEAIDAAIAARRQRRTERKEAA